jgi:methionine synthase I (cobalamin-dependent)
MAYEIIVSDLSGLQSIFVSESNMTIPLDPANRHYQEVLDAIIEQGADCFDGDIPEDLQAAADAKAATNSE